SVTFVDYTQAERVHTEMAKALNCGPGQPQSQCTAAIGGADSAAQGIGAWKYDVLGAVDHATCDTPTTTWTGTAFLRRRRRDREQFSAADGEQRGDGEHKPRSSRKRQRR
ncbi:MAG TPA: hypothetical protein VFU28_12360, partial [Vicinamibacterales bacterium]|nr:hypothetical protein [Vicinamibacterales bacterium]